MKLCYIDESGNLANDPCLVMVGLLIDAHRLRRTREEFGHKMDSVAKAYGDRIKELKGSKIIGGKNKWREVEGDKRKELVESFCSWIEDRKHALVLSAIARDKLKSNSDKSIPNDPWLAASLHLALQIQKHNQNLRRNKGNTLLIMDDHKQMVDKLSDLLFEPPSELNSYHAHSKDQGTLSQIIDTVFAVKSHHVGLIQVADLFAYIFRRHVELSDYGKKEEFQGESDFLRSCIRRLEKRLLPKSARWPEKPKECVSRFYCGVAPTALRELGTKKGML